MRRRIAIGLQIASLLCLWTAPVAANQAEARDVARAANCQPDKLETLRMLVGGSGETVFKITCAGAKDAFVLVQCRVRQCILLR